MFHVSSLCSFPRSYRRSLALFALCQNLAVLASGAARPATQQQRHHAEHDRREHAERRREEHVGSLNATEFLFDVALPVIWK